MDVLEDQTKRYLSIKSPVFAGTIHSANQLVSVRTWTCLDMKNHPICLHGPGLVLRLGIETATFQS